MAKALRPDGAPAPPPLRPLPDGEERREDGPVEEEERVDGRGARVRGEREKERAVAEGPLGADGPDERVSEAVVRREERRAFRPEDPRAR